MSHHHFIVEQPVTFAATDTIKPHFDRAGNIVGFDKVAANNSRTRIPGKMVDRAPLDPRAKMSISISGVQLYYGWSK